MKPLARSARTRSGAQSIAVATLALLAATGTLTGCISSDVYRPHAFVPALRHYRVRYADGGAADRRLLPAGWRVLGYRVDGEGRPTFRHDGFEAWTNVGIDRDGDGHSDLRGRAPAYDLRYEHEDDGATIDAITIPLPPREARRSLGIVAHRLLDGVFGRGFVVHRGGDRSHAFATRVVDENEAIVGGAPAYLLTFEVAEVVPGAGPVHGRGETLTVVVVRPGRLEWRLEGHATTSGGVPMILVLVYAARSERYALHRADFDALLDRLDVHPAGLDREERASTSSRRSRRAVGSEP